MKKLILLTLLILSVIIVPSLAQEQTTYLWNKSINYNRLDNPYSQWRIKQGAEVYTGRSYDISGAIGSSDFIAHWSNWKTEDQDCQPDTIIPVTYWGSNGAVDPKNFYINPGAFPTGNYYSWDGCREWTTQVKDKWGNAYTETHQGQAPNENRFAFTVKSPNKVAIPVRYPDPLPAYTLPAFAIPKPGQTNVPIPVNGDTAHSSPWWIQWWWLELIIAGIVGYVLNDEFDIL
jgi:hypothetical protein